MSYLHNLQNAMCFKNIHDTYIHNINVSALITHCQICKLSEFLSTSRINIYKKKIYIVFKKKKNISSTNANLSMYIYHFKLKDFTILFRE